jgi:hypothetical protein
MDALHPDTFVVRRRLWRLWLQMTLFFQVFLILVIVFPALLIRWLTSGVVLGLDDVIGLTTTFVLGAILWLGMSVLGERWTRIFVSPDGVRPPDAKREGKRKWQRVYRWRSIVAAQLLGRFPSPYLLVEATSGPSFVFPLDVTDPAGLLAAVHRFAGPDHPLAVALRHHLSEESA